MWMKRCLDIALSLIGIIILLPVLIIVGTMVFFNLGKPILFVQERVGKGNKIFKMYKFRTMLEKRDKKGDLLSDEERLTSFGRVLRSTSLDELPELINVLKGDMSLVGPRPLLVEYLPIYNERQRKRHEVLPGITGWAQINGRNSISWANKLELDVWYVEHWSLWLDIKILFKTIYKVFKRAGISQVNNVTVEKFNGLN
ncbi:sugar transferase [Clostridium thermarum]|uniref:sugar transferase n=1 Tax=Clostridium thermarum TaxID=1716543 RepID=UPI0013D081F1|nr:sugar transferase [Clostridium thermarum]